MTYSNLFCNIMLFLLSLLSQVCESLNCASYMCSLSNLNLNDTSYCIYSINNIYHLGLCNSILYGCNPISPYNQTKCTYQDPYVPYSLLPGNKCIYASDCAPTNDCVSNICRGFIKGASCSQDSACDIGLYCAAGVCASQIPINGNGCLDDNDCVNGAGCNNMNPADPTLNKCLAYFSLAIGTQANNIWLCQSSYIFNSACVTAPVSASLPMQCVSNEQCTSKPINGLVYTSECVCGYNPTGSAYCELFNGDADSLKAINMMKQWVGSTNINKCHTSDRFGEGCMKEYWGAKNFRQFSYYYLYATQYAFLQDAEECAIKIFATEYYSALADYKHNSAVYFLLGLGIYFV